MNGNEIQRCDECDLFESDDDAAEAVRALTSLLGQLHRYSDETVADSFNAIKIDVAGRILLRKELSSWRGE